MLDVTAPIRPTTPKSVTTKHLAYELADQHALSKRQATRRNGEGSSTISAFQACFNRKSGITGGAWGHRT